MFRFDPDELHQRLAHLPELKDWDDIPQWVEATEEVAFLALAGRAASALPYVQASLSHIALARVIDGDEPHVIVTVERVDNVRKWQLTPFSIENGDKLTYGGGPVIIDKLLPAIAVMRWLEPYDPARPHFVLQRWLLPLIKLGHDPMFAVRREASEDEI